MLKLQKAVFLGADDPLSHSLTKKMKPGNDTEMRLSVKTKLTKKDKLVLKRKFKERTRQVISEELGAKEKQAVL